MSPDWAVAVFGWPGPILAIALSVAGVADARASLLVLAAIAISPFSFYLLLTPRFPWGIALPLLPLIAARAVSRDAERFAWAAVVSLAAILASIAFLLYAPRPLSVPSVTTLGVSVTWELASWELGVDTSL